MCVSIQPHRCKTWWWLQFRTENQYRLYWLLNYLGIPRTRLMLRCSENFLLFLLLRVFSMPGKWNCLSSQIPWWRSTSGSSRARLFSWLFPEDMSGVVLPCGWEGWRIGGGKGLCYSSPIVLSFGALFTERSIYFCSRVRMKILSEHFKSLALLRSVL